MKYTEFSERNIKLSGIVLGTWAIGGSNWGPSDDREALKAVEAAAEAGMAIDTAPAYGNGHAEELVGRAVKGRRDSVVIASKCGLRMSGRPPKDLSPEFIAEDLNGSLKRLGTDCIDIYQCHWPDEKVPVSAVMECLERFREQGKIRQIGLCNYSAAGLSEVLEYGDVFSLQPHYSLLERRAEEELLPLCREKGLAVLSYGSLGAGVLTGKYTSAPSFPKSDARSFFYRFFKPACWPAVNEVVKTLRFLAAEKHTEPGHLALAWILAKGVTSAIAGARNTAQVLDNLKAADTEISPEEVQILDQVSLPFLNIEKK